MPIIVLGCGPCSVGPVGVGDVAAIRCQQTVLSRAPCGVWRARSRHWGMNKRCGFRRRAASARGWSALGLEFFIRASAAVKFASRFGALVPASPVPTQSPTGLVAPPAPLVHPLPTWDRPAAALRRLKATDSPEERKPPKKQFNSHVGLGVG